MAGVLDIFFSNIFFGKIFYMLPILATSQHESFWAFRFECSLLRMRPNFILYLMFYTSIFLKVFLNCSTWRRSLLRPKNAALSDYELYRFKLWMTVCVSLCFTVRIHNGVYKIKYHFLIFNGKTRDNFKINFNTNTREILNFFLTLREGTILHLFLIPR